MSAAQAVKLGDCEVAVACRAESMSRGQYWLPAMRWGQRMQDGAVVDAMVGAPTDPFDACHMGVTAENVATDYGVSRDEQDALAAESHRRAAAAVAAGYFTEQITAIEVPGKKGVVAALPPGTPNASAISLLYPVPRMATIGPTDRPQQFPLFVRDWFPLVSRPAAAVPAW